MVVLKKVRLKNSRTFLLLRDNLHNGIDSIYVPYSPGFLVDNLHHLFSNITAI